MAVNIKQNTDGTMSFTKGSNDVPVSRIGGPVTATATAPAYHGVQTAKVALSAVDTAGGFFAWANPETVAIMVIRLVLDITTNSSGACTVDCGIAANGTTLNDTLIDGASVATAAKVLDNVNDAGTNGKARQKVAVGSYVTGSVASGASAGVVGSAYIEYVFL
jgi:hypothetical protein